MSKLPDHIEKQIQELFFNSEEIDLVRNLCGEVYAAGIKAAMGAVCVGCAKGEPANSDTDTHTGAVEWIHPADGMQDKYDKRIYSDGAYCEATDIRNKLSIAEPPV